MMKKVELKQILGRSIPFHVEILKLLGKWNGLLTCAVDIDAINYLTIMYDYVIKLLKLYN